MTDAEKGDARAQGALANWVIAMHNEMRTFDRSPEYQAQFWSTVRAEMAQMIRREPN